MDSLFSWMKTAGITEGPLFRRMAKGGKVLSHGLTPHSIGAVVKNYAKLAGSLVACACGLI